MVSVSHRGGANRQWGSRVFSWIWSQPNSFTYGAYQASGQVAALIGASRPENMADALEQTAARMEQGTVHLRALCESCLPPVPAVIFSPSLVFFGKIVYNMDNDNIRNGGVQGVGAGLYQR